jgi:formiminoglutamase
MTWTGRIDGDGPAHARWHQLVRTASPVGPHVSLLGFASDEGVRRNLGRVGAAKGPAALRRALSSMALHGKLGEGEVAIHDRGDVVVDGEALESGQEAMGARIRESLAADGNVLTVVLGGGHETAWASYLGLGPSQHGARWGVLNLDAHFDLRVAARASSGTPFAQMAAAQQAAGEPFHYGVVGIARSANTRELFERADALGVDYMLDTACSAKRVVGFVENFAAGLDELYLTVDLDVLPAAVAPGVSAPAALGVETRTIVAAVQAAASTGKLRLMDVVELNPDLDVDGRTARTAARLVADAVATVAG